MKKLIIDTSVEYLYICFMNDNEIDRETYVLGNNNHSEKLTDVLERMLKEAGLEAKDFGAIYVGRGPGSYTGLRVSGTVAKVLAFVCGKPLYSISSLDMIASSQLNRDGLYLIKIPAKRGYHYAKVLRIADGEAEVLLPEDFYEDTVLEENTSVFSDLIVIDDRNAEKYDPRNLFRYHLVKEETNVNAYVPNYLRRGV